MMSFIVSLIVLIENFNMSNFTRDWLYTAFSPYIAILGNLFYVLFFIVFCGLIYVSERNTFQLMIALLIITAGFGILFPTAITLILLVVAIIIATFLVIDVLTKPKVRR